MKRLYFLLLILFILASCGNGTGEFPPKYNIIGKWQHIQPDVLVYNYLNSEVYRGNIDAPFQFNWYLVFKSDGTFTKNTQNFVTIDTEAGVYDVDQINGILNYTLKGGTPAKREIAMADENSLTITMHEYIPMVVYSVNGQAFIASDRLTVATYTRIQDR